MGEQCKYSCGTASETLDWIHAIIDFIKPYNFLINSHVVNFFKDRLWEAVDEEWIHCLHQEPIQNLLLIPSGVVQEHWPASLKEFVLSLRSLVFAREQVDLQKVIDGLNMMPLNSVIAQGMNLKKKHEVVVLSAVVSSVANSVRAQTIIDVGAGQGYLAQVLSFQYQHSVVAIDACSHHGRVTERRSEQIKKHYTSRMRRLDSGNQIPNAPKIVTCRVMSSDMLETLTSMSLHPEDVEQPELSGQVAYNQTSMVLAGLHACGDLSVTMLKTFLECTEVKAVVSIGCCYNLLSEGSFDDVGSQCGFPVSNGVKDAGISLGKNSRDLACQSAEKWSFLEKDAAIQNFELHAFRAAFQLVLYRYYPEIAITSPSIGRQGKALRRRKQKNMQSSLHHEESKCSFLPVEGSNMKETCITSLPADSKIDDNSECLIDTDALSYGLSCNGSTSKGTIYFDKYVEFEKFSQSGLSRLGLQPLQEVNFREIWNEAETFAGFIGPYWSLRAALGPVLETLLLLDRLLFLQEQGSEVEAVMLPIFDPALSPRNVAIIGKRT